LIGDRGVNLSGGQKARLGLARALYQDKEIYLMDDPTSALDAHVRAQIIENVYFGALKDKTRILVTHAIDFLERADHIILMEEGCILRQGSYSEMLAEPTFAELLKINELNRDAAGAEESSDEEIKPVEDDITEDVKYPSKLSSLEKLQICAEY
jgi:ABC-type multidrug transport system fused ATPase/permease subunit